MATGDYLLPIGVPTIIMQNVGYSLPAKLVRITSSLALEHSVNGVLWVPLTGAETVGAETSSAYVRCSTGQPTVVCKTR
jgi:hypothetical protein